MMARALIISYFFPPDGGPGTQRALKFAKYLWRYGWSSSVLTRAAPEQRGRWDPEDETLLREIPSHVDIRRVTAPTQAGTWARALPVLDNDATHAWSEAAFEAAAEIAAAEPIDVAFITMSPFDLAHLGRRIQVQLGVPVVYDLRDPWALDGWRVHRSRARWQVDFDAMARTLTQANGVVVNTPAAREAMLDAFPSADADRIVAITNGYDEEDFDRTTLATYRRDPDVFRLVHAGSLHAQRTERERGVIGRLKARRRYVHEPIDPSGRTLEHLLDAVRHLRASRHSLADRLRIVLAGVPDEATTRQVRRAGLDDAVEGTGYLPHGDAVALLQGADGLFLPLHGLPSGRTSLIVPGKTYEYLASGRPVLGCLPPGDARRLVSCSPYGLCAEPCDARDIAAKLATMLEAWDVGRLDSPAPPSWISRFERRQLSAHLAEFFDRVAGRRQQIVRRRAA